MRAEGAARGEKTQAQIGSLTEAVVRQTKRIDSVADAVAAMRNDMHTVSIAVDHHSSRLDVIETRLESIKQHLGLDKLAAPAYGQAPRAFPLQNLRFLPLFRASMRS